MTSRTYTRPWGRGRFLKVDGACRPPPAPHGNRHLGTVRENATSSKRDREAENWHSFGRVRWWRTCLVLFGLVGALAVACSSFGEAPSSGVAPDDASIDPWLDAAGEAKQPETVVAGEDAAVADGSDAPSVLEQWASRVVGFSSQWGDPDFSAAQATGAPNTTGCGDIPTAWAPKNLTQNDGEYVYLGFTTPVHAVAVSIHETGEAPQAMPFVKGIDLVEPNGTAHALTIPTDKTTCPGFFTITFSQTSYVVDKVKVHTSTNTSGYCEEIDAVKLSGYP